MLLELGPHLVDQALHVVRYAAARSRGRAFRQREGSQVDDAFDVCLEYAGVRGLAAGENHRLLAGAAFCGAWHDGFVREIWNGSARRIA